MRDFVDLLVVDSIDGCDYIGSALSFSDTLPQAYVTAARAVRIRR